MSAMVIGRNFFPATKNENRSEKQSRMKEGKRKGAPPQMFSKSASAPN